MKSFDGVPLDVNVTLPAAAQGDGPFPLVVQLHGWGGSKGGVSASKPWADRGYAVLNYTARGFGESCGSASSRLADPTGCAKGWIHLGDSRFEARDTQFLAGKLADENLIAPKKIGVTGMSYGGGQSMELAALRNRVRNINGSYSLWKSPQGKDMQIAGAAPVIPWSDLVYSLTPNGHTLDYQVTSDTADLNPTGLAKQSFISGLYLLGSLTGYYAPPGADPDADLTNWFARINAGEPTEDPVIADIKDEISKNHSAYYLDRSVAPAPLLIANGFTDDLFPVDEAVRYANLVNQRHPSVPVSQLHFDFGHQRGQNKAADQDRLKTRQFEWFDRYVKGDTSQQTLQGAEALTQTCPKSAPSGGPFHASTWLELSPGEVRYQSTPAKSYLSAGGNPTVDATVDPVSSGNDPCKTTPSTDQSGVATWRLPTAAGAGYTLLGSPTVIGDLKLSGTFPHLIGRLWDVAPGGTQTLVARGTYRPTANGRQVFQLHANGWHFAAGHTAKLELLGRDAPYARPSNGTFSVQVSNLDFRLPVAEKPGTGPVTAPAPNFVPGQPATGGSPTQSASKAPACVGSRAHLGRLGYRRIRLGAAFTSIASRAGLPSRMTRRRFAYCVRGGGKVVVAFTSRGRAALIAATATNHGARHLSPGDSLRRLRRVLGGEGQPVRGLWRAPGSRAVFLVRRGRVRAVMVAQRGLLKSPRRLKAYFKLARP